MKNRRLWEKRLQALSKTAELPKPLETENAKNQVVPLPSFPSFDSLIEQERLRVNSILSSVQTLKNAFLQISLSISSNDSDKVLMSQINVNIDLLYGLLLNYSVQLFNPNVSFIDTFNSYSIQIKELISKLFYSYNMLHSRPALHPLLTIFMLFHSQVNGGFPLQSISPLNTPVNSCPANFAQIEKSKLPAFNLLLEEIDKEHEAIVH